MKLKIVFLCGFIGFNPIIIWGITVGWLVISSTVIVGWLKQLSIERCIVLVFLIYSESVIVLFDGSVTTCQHNFDAAAETMKYFTMNCGNLYNFVLL